MMNINKCWLLATIILASVQAHAQTFDPEIPISQLTYTQWTTSDGLSSSNTTDVLSDHHGMIWITSFNGYMIFDAERIEIFDKSNTPKLETDGFLRVEQAPDLSIYFGSQGSGLLRYDHGNLEVITSEVVNIPKSIRSLTIDDEGTVYFGGQNSGLFILKNDSVYKYPGESIASVSILSIEKGKDGTLWLGTEGKGVFEISNGQITNYNFDNGLLSNYVNDLHILDDGTVTAATPKGLHQLKNGKADVIEALRDVYTNVFIVDEWGTYWIGGEAGFFRYDPKNNNLEKLTSNKDIDFVRISSIMKDANGSIWMTSSRFGLVNIKESLVQNISSPQLSSDRANIVHEDSNGRILIGTDQNHLEIWNNNKIEVLPIKTDLLGNGVRGIWDEPDGTLWLATYAGMVQLRQDSEKLYSTTTGMPANTFRVVIKDRRDNYWFGTRSGGLIKFRDDEIIEIYDLTNQLESNFILALAESDRGEIFVGTNGGGFTVIYPDGKSRTFHLKEDDSGILIFNVDVRPNGTAVLTTNTGPAYFDGQKIIPVKLELSGRSSTYFDVVWDKKEHLWLTTNNGIFKIEKTDWYDFLDEELEEVPFTLINEMSGMNNRECTGATKSTITDKGILFFPTLGGVSIIDPNTPEYEYEEAAAQIRKISVDDQSYLSYDQPLAFGPDVNRIEFHYSLLSFLTLGQNRYRYQLIGFDEKQSSVTTKSTVSYTNIPPGKYTFQVEGSSDGKKWSSIPATFEFSVRPNFYETYLFYVILTGTIIAILFLIYRWRLSFINRQNIKLKKVNAELDRFVYSASHELRSPLTSVLGIVSLAKEVKGDISEYLGHIENSVKRLDSFIKDIIDYSRNTRLEIANAKIDFDVIIHDILEDISYTEHFQKIKTIYENQLTAPFYCDNKRLKIAVSNLINNVIKHHDPDANPDAFVKTVIKTSGNQIKITIEDNGPGIEEVHQPEIFKMFYRATVRTEGSGLGLYIVHEIIERLKGQIHMISHVNVGTKFEITLPNQAAPEKNK